MKFVLKSLSAVALCMISGRVGAVLKPSELLSASVTSIAVPGKNPEICVIPQHFADGKYGKKDVARETALCSYEVDQNVAACAKVNSTNPGVNFESSDKESVADLTRTNCAGDDSDKLAKYKLSTSCSYTPALLAYYHVSRMLGDIGGVPVAVLRTMDLQRHLGLADRALGLVKDNTQLIYKTWAGLKSALAAGRGGSHADQLFVEGYQQSYGALQKNPKGEKFYGEFFNKGADRAAAFRDGNAIYKSLTTLPLNIGRDLNEANLQKFVQLKDGADMILLDTLLNQQDRFGNIHYKEKYFYATTSKKKGKFKLKSEKDLQDIPAELQSQAIKVKVMLLKDNDCGVSKENKLKEAGLLNKVAHMDPSTYKRLQILAGSVTTDEVKNLFLHGMLFTEADYQSVLKNIQEAAGQLKTACNNGRLKLDLDADVYFSGAALPDKSPCELEK